MKVTIQILPFLILGMLSIRLTTGSVRFGNGLGDIVFHGLIYIGLIFYGIFFVLRNRIFRKTNLIFPISAIVLCGYLILSMTIWRGSEYPWNGHILVPTSRN